jgi:hypothetical protein
MFGFIAMAIMGLAVVYALSTYSDKIRARKCKKYRYVYRPYVKTFVEEQTQAPSVFKMYKDMFWQQSPWVSTHANPEEKSTGRINPFVWGGLPKTDLGTERESDDYVNSAFG